MSAKHCPGPQLWPQKFGNGAPYAVLGLNQVSIGQPNDETQEWDFLGISITSCCVVAVSCAVI